MSQCQLNSEKWVIVAFLQNMTDELISLFFHKTHDVILLKVRNKSKQVPDRLISESQLNDANATD